MTPTVLTIGHSNHTLEKFVELLRMYGVAAVADVRSSPHSRFNPDFDQDVLKKRLGQEGILYVFMGRELGGRPSDPGCYVQGRVSYVKVAGSTFFRAGIEQLMAGAQAFQTALLCAEREPLACHRTLLIAPALARAGVSVAHIHADGKLETHDDAMKRLLGLLGMQDHDLYHSKEEMIASACTLQAQKVAYVDEEMAEEASA